MTGPPKGVGPAGIVWVPKPERTVQNQPVAREAPPSCGLHASLPPNGVPGYLVIPMTLGVIRKAGSLPQLAPQISIANPYLARVIHEYVWFGEPGEPVPPVIAAFPELAPKLSRLMEDYGTRIRELMKLDGDPLGGDDRPPEAAGLAQIRNWFHPVAKHMRELVCALNDMTELDPQEVAPQECFTSLDNIIVLLTSRERIDFQDIYDALTTSSVYYFRFTRGIVWHIATRTTSELHNKYFVPTIGGTMPIAGLPVIPGLRWAVRCAMVAEFEAEWKQHPEFGPLEDIVRIGPAEIIRREGRFSDLEQIWWLFPSFVAFYKRVLAAQDFGELLDAVETAPIPAFPDTTDVHIEAALDCIRLIETGLVGLIWALPAVFGIRQRAQELATRPTASPM